MYIERICNVMPSRRYTFIRVLYQHPGKRLLGLQVVLVGHAHLSPAESVEQLCHQIVDGTDHVLGQLRLQKHSYVLVHLLYMPRLQRLQEPHRRQRAASRQQVVLNSVFLEGGWAADEVGEYCG